MSLLSNIFLNKNLKKLSKPKFPFKEPDKELEERLFPIVGESNPISKWAFGFAGPLSAKNLQPCNMFLGSDKPKRWQSSLYNDWEVANKSEYIEYLEKNLVSFSTLNDHALLPMLNETNYNTIYNHLLKFNYDEERAHNYANAIPIITKMFKDSKWFQVPDKSLKAWDLVRVAFYILTGYSAGYITKEKAFDSLIKVGIKANYFYNDWFSYTSAYLYGRKLWVASGGGYNDETFTKTNEDFERNITFNCSPLSVCRTIPFSYEGAKALDKKYKRLYC